MNDGVVALEAAMTVADEARFLELLDRHRRILFRIAGVYGRSALDRQDLAQDMVVELWRSFPRYDPARPFATWMYRVALNVAISFHRSDRVRRRALVDDGDAVIALAPSADPASMEEEICLLHAAIAGLNELDRALVLLYLVGEKHDAIGQVLGISESNVGTRIGRIKERLRRDLGAAS